MNVNDVLEKFKTFSTNLGILTLEIPFYTLRKKKMFAHLKGTIEHIGEDHLVLDVCGVGYLVHASRQTLSHFENPVSGNIGNITGNSSGVKLFIETLMRQESLTLFGFENKEEQAWFNLLVSVQGVGPRVALGILGVLSLEEITTALITQDKATISRGDGVGPKLAARILLELKDKCKNMEIVAGTAMKTGAVMKSTHGPVSDALSALQNLGYSPSEAYHVLGSIEKKEDLDSASLIRLCLQSLKVGGAA